MSLAQGLHYPFHEGRVQVMDEKFHEGHFLPGILVYDHGIIAGTPQAVRRHHHGQVTGIHLGSRDNLCLGEVLQESDEVG